MAPMALTLTSPTTPDFSAQLQRVETLHQQLKIEAARAQEFLAKLKRGEEINTQSQLQARSLQSLQPLMDEESDQPLPKKAGDHLEKDSRNGKSAHKDSVCCCQHHQSKSFAERERRLAEEYRKSRLSPPSAPDLPPLPTHVDEREVRDLEKRVRGLEGRVRGFEGMPPDREMALLEVERLRKELEGLARRREGLFGLIDEKGKGSGNINGGVNGKIGSKDGQKLNGKANGKG